MGCFIAGKGANTLGPGSWLLHSGEYNSKYVQMIYFSWSNPLTPILPWTHLVPWSQLSVTSAVSYLPNTWGHLIWTIVGTVINFIFIGHKHLSAFLLGWGGGGGGAARRSSGHHAAIKRRERVVFDCSMEWWGGDKLQKRKRKMWRKLNCSLCRRLNGKVGWDLGD